MKRPTCPECGEELVFVALAVASGGQVFRTWQCDCDYDDGEEVPEGLPEHILDARAHSDEASLVWAVEPVEIYPMLTYSSS